MATVVYVMGYSRSGSTILDIVLGNHPRIFSTGELCNFYRYGHLQNQFCSCRRPVRECTFWSAVTERLVGRLGSDDFRRQYRVQQFCERHRYWPLHPLHGTLFRAAASEYKKQLSSLYHAIAECSGCDIVVDSSKSPIRAQMVKALADEGHVRAVFVHLVRDGRGVLWSCQKVMGKDPRQGRQKEFKALSAHRVALTWVLNGLECSRVLAGCDEDSAVRIEYESLCREPGETVDRILTRLDLDATPVLPILDGRRDLQVTHLVSGSRHRMNGQMSFNPDEEWKERLSEQSRKRFWSLAGWYARRLGYGEANAA